MLRLTPLGVLGMLALAGCAARLPTEAPSVAAGRLALPADVLASADTTVQPLRSLRMQAGVTHRRIIVGGGSPDGAEPSAVVALASRRPIARPAPRPVPTPVRRTVRARTVQTAVAAPAPAPRVERQEDVRRLFAPRTTRTTDACPGGT